MQNTSPQQIQRVLWITLGLNVLVAISKIALGTLTGALAITADGFHSLTDGVGNVVGLVANRYASRPADENHPYGHHRFASMGALMMAVLLLLTAWEVAKSVLERIQSQTLPETNALTLVILVATLIINVGVSRYQIREGNRLKSQILLADAQNTSADVYVTSAVIVSMLAVAITGWVWLDWVCALVVLVLIIKAAVGMMKQTGSVLVDTAPYTPQELEALLSLPLDWHITRIRSRGASDASFIDIDIAVPAHTTIQETERIADSIRATLNQQFTGIEEIDVDFISHTPQTLAHPLNAY